MRRLALAFGRRMPLKYVLLETTNGDLKNAESVGFRPALYPFPKRWVLLQPLGQHRRQGSVFSTNRPTPVSFGVRRSDVFEEPRDPSNQKC